MKVYADTSFIVKLLSAESDTPATRARAERLKSITVTPSPN